VKEFTHCDHRNASHLLQTAIGDQGLSVRDWKDKQVRTRSTGMGSRAGLRWITGGSVAVENSGDEPPTMDPPPSNPIHLFYKAGFSILLPFSSGTSARANSCRWGASATRAGARLRDYMGALVTGAMAELELSRETWKRLKVGESGLQAIQGCIKRERRTSNTPENDHL